MDLAKGALDNCWLHNFLCISDNCALLLDEWRLELAGVLQNVLKEVALLPEVENNELLLLELEHLECILNEQVVELAAENGLDVLNICVNLEAE